MNFKKALLYGVTSAFLFTTLSCTPVHALTLEQLSTVSNSIDVFFHDDGADLSGLTTEDITAALDGNVIPVQSLKQSDERINYMFLLDISGSVPEAHMAAAKQDILEIYHNLNEEDLLSVITFGNEVHTILNGTETYEEAQAILNQVHCEDNFTHFYDAVDLMLETLEGVSDMHNIAVVVSDGINTGDASTTIDSLRTRFSGSGISLYALAVDSAEPSALESFQGFIELSGGELFTFSPDTSTTAMEELLLSIDNIWKLSMNVAPELATGQTQMLTIQMGTYGTLQREVILEAREVDTTPPTIAFWQADQDNHTLTLYFSEAMADLKNPEHYQITNPDGDIVPVTVLLSTDTYVQLSIDSLKEEPGWYADFVRLMDASPNRNLLQYETLLLTPAPTPEGAVPPEATYAPFPLYPTATEAPLPLNPTSTPSAADPMDPTTTPLPSDPTIQPGTTQPGTTQPGTAQPGTAQPGTAQSKSPFLAWMAQYWYLGAGLVAILLIGLGYLIWQSLKQPKEEAVKSRLFRMKLPSLGAVSSKKEIPDAPAEEAPHASISGEMVPAEEPQAPKQIPNISSTSLKSGGFTLSGISTTKHSFHMNLKSEIDFKNITFKKDPKSKSKTTLPKQDKPQKAVKTPKTPSIGSRLQTNYRSSKPKNINFTFGDNQKK